MHLQTNVLYLLLHVSLSPIINGQLATWSSVYDSPVIRDPKPGWARFCKGGDVYNTFGNQCPVGIFWDQKNDNGWDCICTRGPWRRSAGWCSSEDTQRFTQGDLTCFKPSSEESSNLQGMYYLGDRFSAWDSGQPILLTDYRSGFPIRKGEFAEKWEISSRTQKTPGILVYRPRDDWAVTNKFNKHIRICLRAPQNFNEETEGLFIYNVSKLFDPSGGEESIKLNFERGCYSWNEPEQNEWHEVIGENLEHKNMIVPAFNKATASEECRQCVSHTIPPAPEADIDGAALEEREEFTIPDLKNVAVLRTEVDLQSERLGLYWAYRVLQNGTDYVEGYIQEMEILTRAALMALGACAFIEIPSVFFTYNLIMFKMLLSESFKKYAPKGPISPEYYTKINELLDKCRKRSTPIMFTKGESCPTVYESFEGANGTQKINISSDYTSDKGRHDFLLEFIWRLKSYLHYNCFEEFQMDSTLHDVVQHQLESLFTEDLILRWYNPGNSYQMYDLIFSPHFDLDQTMRNFQTCVAAVHDMSKYPVWLKRPIDRPEVKPKPGSGGIIRFKRNEEMFPALNSPKSRRKRATTDADYEDDENGNKGPYNLFSGSAACIKSIRSFMTESKIEDNSNCW